MNARIVSIAPARQQVAAARVVEGIKQRAAARYPDKTINMGAIEAVSPAIVAHHHSGTRIKVTDAHGFTRTGTVSNTTGWVPALLLMHRSNAHGSWDTLSADDRLVAVWNGRKYIDV